MLEMSGLGFEEILEWILKLPAQDKEKILQDGISIALPDGDAIIIAKKKVIEKAIK